MSLTQQLKNYTGVTQGLWVLWDSVGIFPASGSLMRTVSRHTKGLLNDAPGPWRKDFCLTENFQYAVRNYTLKTKQNQNKQIKPSKQKKNSFA